VPASISLCLRIEAAPGCSLDSIADVNAGQGTVTVAACGLADAVLRYYVGTGDDSQADEFNAADIALAPRMKLSSRRPRPYVQWPIHSRSKILPAGDRRLNGAKMFSAICCATRTLSRVGRLFADSEQRLRWHVAAFAPGTSH